MTFRQFVEVKNFFHAGPPLAFGPRLEWKLHGSNQFPPLLSFWISSHFGHVSFEIGTVIFEVTEQQSVPQVNGIVPDIAAPDHVQNFRPDLRMLFLVLLNCLRPHADYRAVPFHRDCLLVRSLLRQGETAELNSLPHLPQQFVTPARVERSGPPAK